MPLRGIFSTKHKTKGIQVDTRPQEMCYAAPFGPELKTSLPACRGASFALNGCINDALCMRHLLKTRFGFRDEDIMLLTDDQANPQRWPTRANMIYQMQMLVWDLQPGDSLFFHFSGRLLPEVALDISSCSDSGSDFSRGNSLA